MKIDTIDNEKKKERKCDNKAMEGLLAKEERCGENVKMK
jgi:hypothetical protein